MLKGQERPSPSARSGPQGDDGKWPRVHEHEHGSCCRNAAERDSERERIKAIFETWRAAEKGKMRYWNSGTRDDREEWREEIKKDNSNRKHLIWKYVRRIFPFSALA